MAASKTNQHNKENKEKSVYKPTAAERTAVEKYFARNQAKPSVRVKFSRNERVTQLEFDHPDQLVGLALVMDALATADAGFLNGVMAQLANTSTYGLTDEGQLNFMLSIIKGIEPRDQLEALLAAQMAAVHVATMTSARSLILAQAEGWVPVDSAESVVSKLTRTFAMQMEALRRYRSGAEQKVTRQQVSVPEGGQARAPRKNRQEKAAQEKATTPPPTLPDTNVVPMPSMGKSKEHDPLAVRRKSNK
jgi:hypothetical protein